MKKRVLSLFMALALCLTMLPTAALAQQTGAADVYTTGEDTAVQDKQAAEAVRAAQALIDALPDEVTADNAEEIEAQLIALDEALAALTEEQLAALDGAIQVYVKACPLFVPLVENGRFRPGDPVIETVAREYLEPLRATGIDTLILGCTHYPLLTEIIADIMGPGVTLIDSGAAAARVLRQTLSDRGALAQRDHGTLTLYASDQPEDFGALAGQFLRRPLESAVQHVDIERY